MYYISLPGIIRVCTHIKLIRRREFKRPLMEALKHSLTVFSHVQLQDRERQDSKKTKLQLLSVLIILAQGNI